MGSTHGARGPASSAMKLFWRGLSSLPQRVNLCLPRLPTILPSHAARSQLTCSVPSRTMASQGDQDLAKFLKEEIATEKQNSRPLPKLSGWDIKADGAEVTLTKKSGGEEVMITLNVNHTVDSAVPDDGTGEAPEMLSEPTFEVDLIKPGGKTLSFTCSYVQEEEHPEGQEAEDEDVFAIDEVTMFEVTTTLTPATRWPVTSWTATSTISS